MYCSQRSKSDKGHSGIIIIIIILIGLIFYAKGLKYLSDHHDM